MTLLVCIFWVVAKG